MSASLMPQKLVLRFFWTWERQEEGHLNVLLETKSRQTLPSPELPVADQLSAWQEAGRRALAWEVPGTTKCGDPSLLPTCLLEPRQPGLHLLSETPRAPGRTKRKGPASPPLTSRWWGLGASSAMKRHYHPLLG